MTISEMHQKLGEILHDHPEEAKTAVVLDCTIIDSDDLKEYPKGVVIFYCTGCNFYVWPDPVKIIQ